MLTQREHIEIELGQLRRQLADIEEDRRRAVLGERSWSYTNRLRKDIDDLERLLASEEE